MALDAKELKTLANGGASHAVSSSSDDLPHRGANRDHALSAA
jgi:hypothetical protein